MAGLRDRCSSKEKIYQELGFESLRVHPWYRKHCLFNKVLNNGHPQYLFNLIPAKRTLYSTRNALMQITTFLKNFFFHLLLMNGTNYILALKKLKVCRRFLRLISLSSYGHFQTLPTAVIMLKDLNFLLDIDLALKSFERT